MEIVQDILKNGCRFYTYDDVPYIQVEFADAAYRFGHSQVRPLYTLNSSGAQGQVFPDCAGNCPVPQSRTIEWSYFFDTDSQHPWQASKKIDTHMAHTLIDLPVSVVGETERPEERSLAYRDLLRGHALDLPTGEMVTRTMGIEPLKASEVGLDTLGWHGETSLWYYILKESSAALRWRCLIISCLIIKRREPIA